VADVISAALALVSAASDSLYHCSITMAAQCLASVSMRKVYERLECCTSLKSDSLVRVFEFSVSVSVVPCDLINGKS